MMGIQRLLLGRPLPTSAAHEERLSTSRAIGAFGIDALSSVAYGPDEILYVLVLAGTAGYAANLPIAFVIMTLMVLVVVSYRQTIHAYPNGGGSFTVAKENLGTKPGLVAAAALMVDYLALIAVSVTAGVQAVGAYVPVLHDHRVLASVGCILLLVLLSLRGIRESGALFAVPTYTFIVSLGAMVLWGGWRILSGDDFTSPHPVPEASSELTAFLVLRAFAGGCSAMTGIEAVANGVPAFRKPEATNAARTLGLLAGVLAVLFLSVVFLGRHIEAVPSEEANVLAQIGRALGGGPLFYLVQTSVAFVLLFAASTAFNGFPLLAAVLAKDEFIPHHFSDRGSRLAYSNGIVAIGLAAIALVFLFDGKTHALVPLYAVGVFLCFTLSQAGMVRHWARVRGDHWQVKRFLSALGATATGLALIVVTGTKFMDGAWVVAVIVPLLVAIFAAIRRHYERAREQLELVPPLLTERGDRLVVVPVKTLNRASAEAINYARSLTGHVLAVHIDTDPVQSQQLIEDWQAWAPEMPLRVLESPYRKRIDPVLDLVDALRKEDPERLVTLLVPEVVPKNWWEEPLHHQTGLSLELAVRRTKGVVVTSIPIRLDR